MPSSRPTPNRKPRPLVRVIPVVAERVARRPSPPWARAEAAAPGGTRKE